MVAIHGRKRPLSALKVFDFAGLSENILEEMVSTMLRQKEISFSPLPSKELSFNGFDGKRAGALAHNGKGNLRVPGRKQPACPSDQNKNPAEGGSPGCSQLGQQAGCRLSVSGARRSDW